MGPLNLKLLRGSHLLHLALERPKRASLARCGLPSTFSCGFTPMDFTASVSYSNRRRHLEGDSHLH